LDLVVNNRRKFLNFVRASVHDLADAEEIVQKVSVKVIARAGTLRDPSRAEAWIYRLLRNEIADHFRQAAVRSRRMEELPDEIAPKPSTASLLQPRACPCAMEEVAKLRPNYSDALQAMEMNDEAVAAYAARKGISANNAMVALHRARKSMRKHLESRCGNCAGSGCFDCICESSILGHH